MIYTLYFNDPFPLYIEFADSLAGQSSVALLFIGQRCKYNTFPRKIQTFLIIFDFLIPAGLPPCQYWWFSSSSAKGWCRSFQPYLLSPSDRWRSSPQANRHWPDAGPPGPPSWTPWAGHPDSGCCTLRPLFPAYHDRAHRSCHRCSGGRREKVRHCLPL